MIYVNGRLVDETEAVLSALDHGFLYGHGLFETMRAYNGKVFCLDAHLERLEYGMRILGWTEIPGRRDLSEAVYGTLAANGLKEASVRLTLSRGIGAPRPDAATCGSPTVVVFAGPVAARASTVEEGWKVVTVSLRRNLSSPLCKIKSANYLDNMLARSEARQQGAQEGIMLNTDGYLAEGTMSNIFLVSSGKLITPDAGSGILPGITRDVVIKLARRLSITTEERAVLPVEMDKADEIFLTSSIMEIIPVICCNQHSLIKGNITALLAKAYQEHVLSVSCGER